MAAKTRLPAEERDRELPYLQDDRERRQAWIEARLVAKPETGESNKSIMAAGAEFFGVSRRTIQLDLSEVYAYYPATDDETRRERRTAARMRWLELTEKALTAQAYGAAVAAHREACKMDGLYEPEKIEITGKVTVAATVRGVVGVLDAEGLAALEVVMRQVDAAKKLGMLPAGEPLADDVS